MKIMWYGVAPWARTGYGKVTKEVCTRLQRHHDVVIFSFTHDLAPIEYNGLKVYPRLSITDQWGANSIKYWFEKLKCDFVIQNFDLWVLNNSFHNLWIPYITYTPIDHLTIPEPMMEDLKYSVDIWVPSKYAQKLLEKEGFYSRYVPHGVNLNIYKPMDKRKCREYFGLDEDAFIFGFVGVNHGGRKNIVGLLTAFKHFIELTNAKPSEVKLVLHTYVHRDHFNPIGDELPVYWNKLGIKEYIRHTPEFDYLAGLEEEEMAMLYNAMDVFVTATCGEGFCIPIIESFACGTPVIAPEFTSAPELVEGRGELANVAEYVSRELTMSWQGIVDTYDLAHKMVRLYNNPSLVGKYSKEALRFVKNFDWNVVVDKYILPSLPE